MSRARGHSVINRVGLAEQRPGAGLRVGVAVL